MEDCCHVDYRKVFRTAGGFRDTKRYLKRGLSGSAATIARLVREIGVDDLTLIEVGAGAGALHVDLLRNGAARATAIDISDGWDAAATALLERTDHGGSVQRIVGDFVEQVDTIPAADVVLLHRVICCYPHWRDLVDASASRARRAVVFTIPRENTPSRLSLAAFNAWLRVQRCGFVSYIHPVDEMLDRFAGHGLAVTGEEHSMAWATYRVERTG